MSESEPLLVTKQAAAVALSCSQRTIDNLLANKELPFRKLGKRTMIPFGALRQLASRNVFVISGRAKGTAATEAEPQFHSALAGNTAALQELQ